MALSTGSTAAAPRRAESAPAWVLALYLGGLVVVYLGEHVLAGLPKGATVISALGVFATLASTVLRFSPRFRSGGERKSIESLLALLSLLGLIGLVVYFATSDAGAARLGLDKMATEARTKLDELSRVVWISLIGLSVVPMVFAETALLPMAHAALPESRRVRAAAGAGLVLALAALYSSLAVYAASGSDLKVDYSFFKTSKPSDSTRKLVRDLSGDPIRVVGFFPDVNEVKREVQSYLRDLASGAPKLKVEVRDRLLAPKLAQEMKANQDGVIVLSRGGVTQTMQIGTELEQARPKLKTLDRDFQEQLLKIANSRHTAFLTVGHGEINDTGRGRTDGQERTAQILRSILQKQNYTVKELGLAQGLANDVPEDAEVVMVLGPTTPLLAEELASLKRYADRGGRLLVALDPETPGNAAQLVGLERVAPRTAPGAGSAQPAGSASAKAPPSVPKPAAAAEAKDAEAPATVAASPPNSNKELAALLGLEFTPGLLANEKQHVRLRFNDSDRTRLVTNSFSSHAAVSTLSRNAPRAAVVMFGAGSLDKATGSSPDTRVDFAVRAMTGTFRDDNGNFSHEKEEKSSSFNMAAALTRPLAASAQEAKPAPSEPKKDDKDKDKKKPKDDVKELRAFVLADADALSDFVMNEVVGNQVMFVDAMRWLVGEQSMQGLPNTEEDVRIEHTKQGDLGWFYAIIFGVPGLVIGAGVFVTRRSRARGGKR